MREILRSRALGRRLRAAKRLAHQRRRNAVRCMLLSGSLQAFEELPLCCHRQVFQCGTRPLRGEVRQLLVHTRGHCPQVVLGGSFIVADQKGRRARPVRKVIEFADDRDEVDGGCACLSQFRRLTLARDSLGARTALTGSPGAQHSLTCPPRTGPVYMRERGWAKYHGQREAGQHARKALHPGGDPRQVAGG